MEAVQSLDKAEGWATWDMIGGGMISTAIKHSHLDDAKRQVHLAQNRLRNFESELADIQQHFHIKLEIQTIQTRQQMSSLVIQLEQQMKPIANDLSLAKEKRLSLIEGAH